MPIPSASRLRAGLIVLGYAAAGALVTSADDIGFAGADQARFDPQNQPVAAMIARRVSDLRYGTAWRGEAEPGRTVAAVPFAAPPPLAPRGA